MEDKLKKLFEAAEAVALEAASIKAACVVVTAYGQAIVIEATGGSITFELPR